MVAGVHQHVGLAADLHGAQLRQAQRFPVAIEIDPAERAQLRAMQIGGQADVLVYTGDHGLMNWLGSIYIRLMSWFAYVY